MAAHCESLRRLESPQSSPIPHASWRRAWPPATLPAWRSGSCRAKGKDPSGKGEHSPALSKSGGLVSERLQPPKQPGYRIQQSHSVAAIRRTDPSLRFAKDVGGRSEEHTVLRVRWIGI